MTIAGDAKDKGSLFFAKRTRALAIAELQQSGWTTQEIAVGLKIIDAHGGVELAISTMHAARKNREPAGQATDMA